MTNRVIRSTQEKELHPYWEDCPWAGGKQVLSDLTERNEEIIEECEIKKLSDFLLSGTCFLYMIGGH